MKHLILIIACTFASVLAASAQPVQEAIDQLAVLRTLGQTLQQGYKTVTTSLTTIGSIRTDEFDRHQSYIHSLDILQPTVAADQQLQDLRTRLTQLSIRLQSTLENWQNQPVLSK